MLIIKKPLHIHVISKYIHRDRLSLWNKFAVFVMTPLYVFLHLMCAAHSYFFPLFASFRYI